MVKYIEAGANLRFFNVFVVLRKVPIQLEPRHEPINSFIPIMNSNDVESLDPPDPPTVQEAPDVDISIPFEEHRFKENQMPSNQSKTGCPFRLMGRLPKHGIFHPINGKPNDSRRFSFK